MRKYYVDYGTGAGNEWLDAETLEDAKIEVEEGVRYTQTDAVVLEGGKNGEEIARLCWYGCSPNEEDEVAVSYGNFGFYSWS